ncbi:hypothetical protein P4C99_21545 [Pontiellaceae bacterium B1224]|nr:hypothetical protein [Pontiellaceae bacterium B1224]
MTSENQRYDDWGEASPSFDEINEFYIKNKESVDSCNEAQTRLDLIDRILKEVFSWKHGQIIVEDPQNGPRKGRVDYVLKSGDTTILVEAKRVSSEFPKYTKRTNFKLNGSVLGSGDIQDAIEQVRSYGPEKDADVLVVTNGIAWCIFSGSDSLDGYGHLLFPFEDMTHAESLFDLLATSKVEGGSLDLINKRLLRTEDRLLSIVNDAGARLERNSLAEHIVPALTEVLYADALFKNKDALKRCFVTTEARSKYDAHLEMHLADAKPTLVQPAPRIRTGKTGGALEKILSSSKEDYAPPVTMIIGPVGAGKSTYLKHFETVIAEKMLAEGGTHWIYIDFEEMGRGGNPREFMYSSLLRYLGSNHFDSDTFNERVVEPAYEAEINSLLRGPLARISSDEGAVNKHVSKLIMEDYQKVEPYVDKLMLQLRKNHLCVLVLDNVDLYEDEELEASVFAEGLALSKRLLLHVLVSIRDTTFVKHKTDATFDAYELRKFWLDPPPFKAVLASRLTYAKKVLKGKRITLALSNSMSLDIPDLSVFFDLVQRSILDGRTGDYIAQYSDLNIRKGIEIITNFLTSGHIQADRAVENYIKASTSYYFPFHEIFKGTMLGQWKYYKEGRADCINIFDSRLGHRSLSLLRLQIITFLHQRAKVAEMLHVSILDCFSLFSKIGASLEQVIICCKDLQKYRLIRTSDALEVSEQSDILLTRCGGYYQCGLSEVFAYAEACLMDTAIYDADAWESLTQLTHRIERKTSLLSRLEQRVERLKLFFDYLEESEKNILTGNVSGFGLDVIGKIRERAEAEANRAVMSVRRRS